MTIFRNTTYLPGLKLLVFILVCSGILFSKISLAQDIHFSQYNATSLYTNPANTGIFSENFRFANDYRNQWSKLGTPFNTYYSSLDTKLTMFNQNFGIGGFLVHDQVAVYGLTTDEFKISLSYMMFYHNHQFIVGIQPGESFKSFNSDVITFGSQFDDVDNVFNTALASNESGLSGNASYFDMNIGIGWRTLINNIMPSAGFSVSHVLKPEVTFSSVSVSSRLARRFNFNSQVFIPLTSKFDVVPGMLFSSVSGSNELLLGGTSGYKPDDFFESVKRLYVTSMVRSNLFSNFDALILGGGAKFSTFDLGITYDLNISQLHHVSNFRGAFEISIVYTGKEEKFKLNSPCHIY